MNKKWTFDGMGIVLENRERVVCIDVATPEDANLIVAAPDMLKVLEHLVSYDNVLEEILQVGFGSALGSMLTKEILAAYKKAKAILD